MAEKDNITINIQDLLLYLPVRRSASQLLKQQLRNATLRSSRVALDHSKVVVKALDGISLQVEQGDRVGLIGRNGAGKSSLLRVMAGIYPPSSGTCVVKGEISTLFTSKLSMDLEASGQENIFLMAYALGMKKSEVEEVFDDIVEFASLDKFLYLPVRSYSAGMATRLGFAVATARKPDILLIDEVFGVGDRMFRKKAKRSGAQYSGTSGHFGSGISCR